MDYKVIKSTYSYIKYDEYYIVDKNNLLQAKVKCYKGTNKITSIILNKVENIKLSDVEKIIKNTDLNNL